jgi:hypothetical protein
MSTFQNLVQKLLIGSYFQESANFDSSITDKYCDLCFSLIPEGTAHKGAKLFKGESVDIDHGEFYTVSFCNDCSKRYEVELKEMVQGLYDNY